MVGMEPLGLIQLGRLLTDRGHEVRYSTMDRGAIGRAVRRMKPEMIAYSICSVDQERALAANRALKREHDFYAVFGGPHTTFFPEMIEEDGVDALCVGEADFSFPDFVDALDAGGDGADTPNMWVRLASGEVAKNAPAALVEDLDRLPYPDREGLYHDRWLREYRMKTFISSRGCPFQCTYCYNRLYRELYHGKGKVWRSRSPGHLVGEIEWVKKEWPLVQVTFVDDVFVPNKKWLEEFVVEYQRRVDLPFTCFLRLDRMDDEQASMLNEAGCRWVFAAIEAGSERVRREVLGRGMSDDQIVAGAEALHRYGIQIYVQNMMGAPGESFEEALQTLRLNVRVKADLGITSLFAPFPNLDLTARAIEEGFFSGDNAELPHNMTARSVLKLEDKAEIERLQKLFPVLLDIPFLRRHVRFLVKVPLHPLYSILRNAWMSIKVYRELLFTPTLRERVDILRMGLRYVFWDR